MRNPLIITNPSEAAIKNATEINAIFLKTDIERLIRCEANKALTDVEFASIIALAIDFNCEELATELQHEYQSLIEREEAVC